jgi:hypothetical protein
MAIIDSQSYRSRLLPAKPLGMTKPLQTPCDSRHWTVFHVFIPAGFAEGEAA